MGGTRYFGTSGTQYVQHHAGGGIVLGSTHCHSVAIHRHTRQLGTWSHTHRGKSGGVLSTMARAGYSPGVPVRTHAPLCPWVGNSSGSDSRPRTWNRGVWLLPRRYYKQYLHLL